MKWLARPELWLLVALLAVAGAGSHFLKQDAFVRLSERDRVAYGQRPVWQARFDALSATCGVGLLSYRLNEDYTPAGRWLLAGLGLVGAGLYLTAARQAAARLWAASGTRLPSAWVVLAVFVIVQALAVVFVTIAQRVSGTGDSIADCTWNAIAAVSSLGWLSHRPDTGHAWIFAVAAFVGALGWPVWLLVRRERRGVVPVKATGAPPTGSAVALGVEPAVGAPGPCPARAAEVSALITAVCGYAAFLLLGAALVTALEMPRGTRQGRVAGDDRLSGQPAPARFARSLVQVACASGAGIPIEDTTDRSISEGTKFVLAGVVLVGGMGGSAGGGIRWPILLWALAAGSTLLGRGSGRCRDGVARLCHLAGIAGVGTMVALVFVVAIGLLLIESWTGSAYQTAPTLADGLLDACSAVGGAGLTSGLTATVTSANLSSGIRQDVDLYQYGMAWLMAAMVIGRVLPVLVLGRCADLHFAESAARRPPLL